MPRRDDLETFVPPNPITDAHTTHSQWVIQLMQSQTLAPWIRLVRIDDDVYGEDQTTN